MVSLFQLLPAWYLDVILPSFHFSCFCFQHTVSQLLTVITSLSRYIIISFSLLFLFCLFLMFVSTSWNYLWILTLYVNDFQEFLLLQNILFFSSSFFKSFHFILCFPKNVFLTVTIIINMNWIFLLFEVIWAFCRTWISNLSCCVCIICRCRELKGTSESHLLQLSCFIMNFTLSLVISNQQGPSRMQFELKHFYCDREGKCGWKVVIRFTNY